MSAEVGESAIGKCGVCSSDAALKCSGCKATYYCGKAHQKSDWKKHKEICRPFQEDMSCAVCNGPTSLRCSGCRSVFYCSRDHQKRHWATHRRECKQTYEMRTSEQLGRYLVAARDFSAGELVLREVALVLGPKSVSECICLGCHRKLGPSATPCIGCGWPLCSTKCRNSPFHSQECAILEKASDCMKPMSLLSAPLSTVAAAYAFVTPLRCLLVKRSSSKSWDSINGLQSHLEERLKTPAYSAYRINIAKFIGGVLGLYAEGFEDETILKMCGILDTNSFEVNWSPKNSSGAGGVKSRGLFPMASMIAHDCHPNTRHIFEQEGDAGVNWKRATMAIYTTVPIKKGDPLTTTYTQSLWPTKRRRDHLKIAKCFSCECKRCSDPSELGSNLSAIRCFQASKGGCKGLILHTDPFNDSAPWKCTCCHQESSSKQIDSINAALHQDILERASKANQAKPMQLNDIKNKSNCQKMQPEILEEFLLKYDKILHPLNHHILQVKYALNQIYGKVAGFTLKELPDDMVQRKEKLCRELLDAANFVEPGLTRFRGELLYDLNGTLLEKTKRDLASEKISKETAKDQHKKANQLLQEALKVLTTEPDMLELNHFLNANNHRSQ